MVPEGDAEALGTPLAGAGDEPGPGDEPGAGGAADGWAVGGGATGGSVTVARSIGRSGSPSVGVRAGPGGDRCEGRSGGEDRRSGVRTSAARTTVPVARAPTTTFEEPVGEPAAGGAWCGGGTFDGPGPAPAGGTNGGAAAPTTGQGPTNATAASRNRRLTSRSSSSQRRQSGHSSRCRTSALDLRWLLPRTWAASRPEKAWHSADCALDRCAVR
ncbi:hypothetical protein VR45_39880 [Streptomyces sp. NRRL S-495]|nr:hypothetical protein VR45_39880 [Streptomyces sp. NRRL S-495]